MGAKGTSRMIHLKKGSYDWTFCGQDTHRKITTHLEDVTCRKCRKAWDSPVRIKEGGKDMVLVRRVDLEIILGDWLDDKWSILRESREAVLSLKAALDPSPPCEPDQPEKG